MDALSSLLEGPRARNAFLLRSVMRPPWSMWIRDEAPLSLMAVVHGQCWVLSGDTFRLGPGDLAIARGPEPYVVADDPATPPQIVIHPGQRCTTIDGESLYQTMDLGVRTWGNDPTGPTVMLTGSYQMDGEITRRLLAALPPFVVLRAGAWDCPLLPVLAAEIGKDDPGQQVILDRLLDLLLISALRTWFSRPEAAAPGWYRAYADPVVGRALRLLQHNPGHPWTVAALAADAGVSRAALARRFTDLVGEPPMAFLTGWRLALAADLLREPDATVGAVARQVGYGSAFALSAAFKRVRGLSPTDHRRHAEPRDRSA